MNNIVLKQISNPGISFTKDMNSKLLSMYEIMQDNSSFEKNYQEFQQFMISNNLFTGSYIRSFIPFLYNVGIVKNYSKIIKFNDFFTPKGKAYILILKNLKITYKYDTPKFKNTLDCMNNIKNDLIALFLNNMIKSNYKFYDKYCDILIFLKNFKTINREEFYIMEYCKQNSLNLSEFINNYRINKEDIKINIIDNSENIVSYRNNNAFNYYIALLSKEQCNFVVKIDQSNYNLNTSRLNLIDITINAFERKNKEVSNG